MRKVLKVLLVVILSTQLFAKTYNISMVQMIDSKINNEIKEGFERALKEQDIQYKLNEVQLYVGKNKQDQVVNQVVTSKSDIIVTLTSGATDIIAEKVKTTPILFCDVNYHQMLKSINQKNVTGISNWIEVDDILKEIRAHHPKAEKIGVIWVKDYFRTPEIPEGLFKQVTKQELFDKHGFKLVEMQIKNENEITRDSIKYISKESDVFILLPSITNKQNLVIEEMTRQDKAVIGLNYSGKNEGRIEEIKNDFIENGYQLGLMASEVLKNKKITNFKTSKDIEYIKRK